VWLAHTHTNNTIYNIISTCLNLICLRPLTKKGATNEYVNSDACGKDLLFIVEGQLYVRIDRHYVVCTLEYYIYMCRMVSVSGDYF
jgi:hypothetical protein